MESIRKGAESTTMKLVFGAILVVFIFWGIGNQGGPTTQLVAKVNGKRITDTDYQRVMREVTRRQGGSLDEDEVKPLARKVIADLIDQEIQLQEAARLGIEVSDEEIARHVLQNDAFKDKDGKFSKTLYQRTLKRNGMTEGRFEEQLRTILTLEKMAALASSSVRVSDAEARRFFEREATRIEVTWVTIPDEALLARVPVDEKNVDAWLSTSKDAIRAQYDKDFERLYKRPAKAAISAILLRTDMEEGAIPAADLKARAEAILAEARAGADFAALARRHSEDLSAVNGGTMGMLAAPQMDPAVAAAVFAAGAGQVTGVIETARGLQIAKVAEVVAEEVTPYEAVEREIARTMLARQDVERYAAELAGRILQEWKATGAAPAALLDEHGLSTLQSGPISPGRLGLLGATGGPALQAALGGVEGAGVLDQVFPIEGGRIVAAVDTFSPADETLFAEEKEAIRTRLAMVERSAFFEAWRADLRSRAKVVQHFNP